MERIFTVNNKTYKAKPFDFNMICDLEDMGISLEQAKEKPMSMVRAYFAMCTGRGKEFAGKEMQAHLINGGTFETVISAMSEEMSESDFFQALSKNSKEEDTTEKKTTRTKKSE